MVPAPDTAAVVAAVRADRSIEFPFVHAGNEPEPAAVVPGDMDGVEPVDQGDRAPRSGLEPGVRIVTVDETDAAAVQPVERPRRTVIGVVGSGSTDRARSLQFLRVQLPGLRVAGIDLALQVGRVRVASVLPRA